MRQKAGYPGSCGEIRAGAIRRCDMLDASTLPRRERMPDLGWQEILVVLVIALLVLGPAKLPGAARSAGKAIQEFKSGLGRPRRASATSAAQRSASEPDRRHGANVRCDHDRLPRTCLRAPARRAAPGSSAPACPLRPGSGAHRPRPRRRHASLGRPCSSPSGSSTARKSASSNTSRSCASGSWWRSSRSASASRSRSGATRTSSSCSTDSCRSIRTRTSTSCRRRCPSRSRSRTR